MEDIRRRRMEKTAEVYDIHAKAMRDVIPVIQKFDGKVLNKRLDTAMATVLPKGMSAKWITWCDMFTIEFHFMDNYYKDGQYSVDYTENREATVRCGRYTDVFETTASGNWKIKAEPIINKLNERADVMESRAAAIHEAIAKADEIVAEAQAAVDPLIQFNHKYDSEIRELLGVYCTITEQGRNGNRTLSLYY